jgi:4-hydroxybenzoate polyprenyltransferase
MPTTKIFAYIRLMRMERPIGAFLLLWPTLWALWIAGNGQPQAKIVLILCLGVFVMRSAGCVINDFADRNIDGHVERTRHRPLATGELSARNAITAFIILLLFALILVLQLNRESLYVAFIALGVASLYPFTKRFTYLPQFVLGIAFSMGIPMAFAAHQGSIPGVAWWLVLANLLLVVAYDTIYAMVDRKDDLKIGIKSTAILFGRFDKIIVFLFGLASLLVLAGIGQSQGMNIYYYGGILLAAINLLYQQWLIKDEDPKRMFNAFLSNNWLGAFVFIGLILNYL